MIEQPSCPLCGAHSWVTLSRKTFIRRALGLSPYVATRYRILFDIWAPGREWLTLRYLLCRRCGIVIFAPRPTGSEIAAKYATLGGATSSTVENPVVTPIDRVRSQEVFESLAPFLRGGERVLDYGGGTGSLMPSFVERGHDCAVIDFAPETIEDVEKLANSLDEVPADRRFDLIIACHVVEHLPSPVETMRSLSSHLEAEGYLFIEVPLELVGTTPRQREPVTHINFFAEPSLRALLHAAGLEVLRCWTDVVTASHGTHELAVRGVARLAPSAQETENLVGSSNDVMKMIQGGWLMKASYDRRFPTRLLNPWRRLRRRWRR